MQKLIENTIVHFNFTLIDEVKVCQYIKIHVSWLRRKATRWIELLTSLLCFEL